MDHNRVHAEINLDAIINNMDRMKENVPEHVRLAAVLKTDAYGHGVVPIAKTVCSLPYVWGCCVATADEAVDLREAGIEKPILVLGYTFPDSYQDMVKYDIRPAILSRDMAEAFSKEAVAQGKKAYCHIKIDTGMGRIGFPVTDEAADEIASYFSLPGLVPEGIFTHFAKADEKDRTATDEQYRRFTDMIDRLGRRGITFSIRHCGNSAGIIRFPEDGLDMMRAGITLYGLWPSDDVDHSFPLQPALSLYSQVAFVKKVPAGTPISYGGTFVTSRPSIIATVPVGYGDGYARSLSNKGEVLLHGKRVPIVGRVCMDQIMVDVTDLPEVSVGDKVTLIGTDGEEHISLEELGDKSGRFNYEFACCLGSRIPRLYYRNGNLVDTVEYL